MSFKLIEEIGNGYIDIFDEQDRSVRFRGKYVDGVFIAESDTMEWVTPNGVKLASKRETKQKIKEIQFFCERMKKYIRFVDNFGFVL